MTQTILNSQRINCILSAAKKQIESQGRAPERVTVRLRTGECRDLTMDLPKTAAEQVHLFVRLGSDLVKHGKFIEEALFLVDPFSIPLLDGTDRYFANYQGDAIVIVGRNASKSKTVEIVQPYLDSYAGFGDAIFWATLNAETDICTQDDLKNCAKLLDQLFLAQEVAHV